MKETLMSNLSLKILSVVAAILIWLVVVNVDDPVRTETYGGIRVTMVNEEAITGKGKVYKIEDNSDVISVQVSAKRSVHKKLNNTDFVATADMEKDIQYDNLVAINVTCNNKNVKATDIKQSRSNVKVSIENSITKEFNVVVKQKGNAEDGYIVGEMVPELRVISVTGPESLIEKIKRLEAEIDVTGRSAGDSVISKLKVVDGNGDLVDTTYLDFYGRLDGIAVDFTMLKTKEVPLKVSVSGTPMAGYRYTGVEFIPETVVVAGNERELRNIDMIRVPGEAVNIEGMSASGDLEVDITPYMPEHIRLADEEADGLIVVTVVLEAEVTKTIAVPVSNISLSGVQKGYSLTFNDLEEIEIPVTALKAELDALTADVIALKLDVSSVERKGTYTLPVQVHIPGAYHVDSVVEVTFELLKGESGIGNTEVPPGTETENPESEKPKEETTESDKETSNSPEQGNTSDNSTDAEKTEDDTRKKEDL